MRVSLIYARSNTSIQPPLGLLWIAAVLEQDGHHVQLVDPLPGDERSVDDVERFAPDLVGLSILTTEYPRARQLTQTLKKRLPTARYCAGGVHPTALPAETMADLGLDFAVVGEGERTMQEVCERLANGSRLGEVRGLVLPVNGKAVPTGPRPQSPIWTSYPCRQGTSSTWSGI